MDAYVGERLRLEAFILEKTRVWLCQAIMQTPNGNHMFLPFSKACVCYSSGGKSPRSKQRDW